MILISAKALLPLFVFMALGYCFRQANLLSDTSTRQLTIIIYRFFLSIMCAETIYKANLREDVELLPVLIVAIGIVASFLISWLIVPRFIKDKKRIPVMVQGIFKANYAILGIPIAQSICGADNLGVVPVIAVILVPLNNVLSAYIFEKYTGKSTGIPKLILNVIKNPLVVASIIGIALNLTGVDIPSWLMTGIISKLSALTTPLSMIALGASFNFSKIREYRKHLLWASLGKLVIIPALIIPISILLGIKGTGIVGITIFAAAPNAVNSYSTAAALGGDVELATEIVVTTSILSIFTMFGWLVLVGSTAGF